MVAVLHLRLKFLKMTCFRWYTIHYGSRCLQVCWTATIQRH